METTLKTKYLDLATKKLLCESVVHGCLEDKEGFRYVNYFTKIAGLHLQLLNLYTNIDVSAEDFDYDTFVADGKMDTVLTQIPKTELQFITDTIDSMLEQELRIHNSLEYVINTNLSKLVDKIPNDKQIKQIITHFSKRLNKVDPQNLKIIQDVFAGIKEGGIDGTVQES